MLEKALKAIANGDKEALSVVYDKLHKPIYSVAWSILKNYSDAEDALQNTLCAVLTSASLFTGGHAKAWVLSIARNQALILAKKRSRDTMLADVSEFEEPIAKDNVESEYTYLDALKTLGEKEREVVVLKVYCRLKHKQIAEIMGITPAASEKLYQRGIAKLRAYYK